MIMANFDPKTKIERLVLKHPALSAIFKEAAATVDDQLTVEEFCFVNGIDFVSFFRRLDEAVADAERRDREQREAVESRISAGNDAVEEKVGVARQGDDMPAEKKHDAVVLGLLLFGVVVYALSAVGNFFAGAGVIRTVLGIHPTEAFPHVPQMLSFLNVVSLGGCALLLLWRRMGVVFLLLGAMIYDVLAVALTDSLPTDTILACIITSALLTVSCNGTKYKDLLR